MKKTITFFSRRAAMMLLATLLLTLTVQPAWADDPLSLPAPDGERNVTITTPGTYTASGHIYGNLIINTSGEVILNVDDLTLDSDDDSNNYDRDIQLENGTLTLNVSNDKSLKARDIFTTTLTMTGGTISASDVNANALTMTGGTISVSGVGVNTINMSAGLIEANHCNAGGTISGGTITVQNFTAGYNTGQDFIKLTISGGTITANETFYILNLEINASTLGLSITANKYNYVYWDSNLSITNGYVTDGTNIYGSGNTYSESLKSYLQGNGGTTLTVAVVYTVAFDKCGGESGDDNAVVMYGHDMPTIYVPTREGYAFGGYFTEEGGSGTQYYNADGTSTRTWNMESGATLYAKWTVVPHIVTSEMRDWAAGTYNVTSNVTIDGTVTITGDVILNINSGCTLTIANGHIDAYSNQGSLTFNGPGTLSVAAEYVDANTFNMTGGTINADVITVAGTISGGTINVVNDFIAGKYTIVGGNDHYDDLTISGGTIETGTLVIASLVIDATNSHYISIKANEYRFDNSGSLTINGTLYAGTEELTGTFNNSNDLSAYNGNYLRTSSYSNTYTVTFNANGGSGTMSPQTFTVGVAQNLSHCTFTRNDHTFDGWATTQGGDVAYTDGQSVTNLTTTAGGSVTLYAHWTENAAPVTTYTVTFDKNGGSGTMAAQTFTVGVAQNLSDCTFTREGYTFDGWATTQGGAKVYDNGASVTDLASAGETTTLYAHWTPNTYTVNFNANGGEGDQMDNQVFTYDVAQNLRECTYSRDGYTFDGWAIADDGAVVYTDKQSVSNLTAVANGTVTLYAHWAQDRIYTEGTYYLNNTNISGDIICKGDVTLYVEGALTVSGIRKEGESFLTINVQDHSSITAGSIDANIFQMNGGTVTAGSINVDNFNMNGGSVNVGSLTASGGNISDGTLRITGDFQTLIYYTISGGNITVGGELQINNELHLEANQATMSIYVKEYRVYAGSLTITSVRGFSDGTTAYNGNSTIANPTALNGKTLKPAYKVTIEENGGSEVEDQFVAYGSTATEPNSTKTGYTATWYKGEDEYNFTAAVEDDFTLRAEWTPKTYTVILDRQGATTGSESVTATYDADMPAITIPTMLGYTFDGYFTETDGGGIQYYDADGTSTRTWDIDATTATTLYAKWEILRFEIGDVTYEWTDETNVKVTGYNGISSSLVIPGFVEYNEVRYNVTEIGEEAFMGKSNLEAIDISNPITIIGARAFKNCTNLSSILLPASLTMIEAEAFSGCNLTKITIPQTVMKIGESAFYNCTSLTSVTISENLVGVAELGENAFENCNKDLIIYVPKAAVNDYRTRWPAYAAIIQAVGTIPYIAADGSKAYCEEYTELTGSTAEVTLGSDGQATWYVVNSDVDYYDVINLVGNVNLILCDDMTMTACGGSASAIRGESGYENSLTIYGQTAGTGELVARTGEGCGICSNAITINGGTVDAYGHPDNSAIYADGNITINGGNVSAYGNQKGIEARGNITLGWTNITTDRISAKNYIVGGTISIADGKVFTDGTNVYNSATPSSTLAALTDVTLVPKKDFTQCTATVPNQIRQYNRMLYQFEAANYGYYSVGETIKDGETTLVLGQDYEFGSIEYADPNKTPTYAEYNGDYDQLGDELVVTINGKDDYTGILYASFKIVVPDANGTMGDLKWVYSDGTLTISKKDDVEGNVAMPDGNNYDDFDWKEVASGVFTLTIDEGITKVGNFAFGSKDGVEHYGNLTTINLPNSLTEIGENAFAYCGGLTVNLDDILAKNITLDNRAFYQIGCLTGSLANNANNDTKIALLDQARSNDVTLSDRTLYRDGYWNTLCLPFDVTVGSDVMADATAMTLNTSTSGFNESTGELTLNFDAVTSGNTIDAGTPFIVKWGTKDSHPDTDITNPVFTGVTIGSTTPTPILSKDNKVSFIGNFSPVTLTADNDETDLYLGGNNKLYWPSSDKPMNSFRAYFHVDLSNPSGGGQAPELKIVLNFGEDENTTAINEHESHESHELSGAWYSLDGRKLDGKPTQKGLYIVNGKKVVIK